MKKNGFHITLLVMMSGLIILYLLSLLSSPMKESAQYNEVQRFYLYRTGELILLLVFGALIEYRKVISIVKNGVVLNPILLACSIVLLILLLMPVSLALSDAGAVKVFFTAMNTEGIRSISGILSGILLIRSFTGEELKQNEMGKRVV